MRINSDNIPVELKALHRWLVWKYGKKRSDGKRTKLPIDLQSGRAIDGTDPANQHTFEAACTAYERGIGDGIGFAVNPEDGLIGLDFDNVVNADGSLVRWAQALIDMQPGFWERSPSGDGIRGFARGTLPAGHRTKCVPTPGTALEVYTEKRFLTITAKLSPGASLTITTAGTQFLKVVTLLLARGSAPRPTGEEGKVIPLARKHAAVNVTPPQPVGNLDAISESIVAALRERNGEKFSVLFDYGDFSAYANDHSSSDLALANMIVAECLRAANDDVEEALARADVIFRHSALIRPKWNEKRGGSTYGRLTLEKSLTDRSRGKNTQRTEPIPSMPVRKKERKHPVLHPDAFHGLAGEVTRTIGEQSEGDPACILSSFLAGFGNAVGLGAYANVGGSQHPPRLFVLHIGDTSTGQKGQGFSDGMHVMKKACPDWYQAAFTTGLGSGEGIKSKLEKQKFHESAKDATTFRLGDYALAYRHLFVYESEFAGLLAAKSRDTSTLSPVIRSAWDTDRFEICVKNNSIQVTDASVSIVGQCTPDELLARLSDGDRANGFANRFLLVAVRGTERILSHGGDFETPEIENLVTKTREAVYIAQLLGKITFSEQAEAFWLKACADFREAAKHRYGLSGALLARNRAQVLRLCVTYAALDGVGVVAPEHLSAALAVWQYVEESVLYIFGEALGDSVMQQLLDEIQDISPDGLSRKQQHQLFRNNIPCARIAVAREALIRAGLAKIRKIPTTKKPREELYACGQGYETETSSDENPHSNEFNESNEFNPPDTDGINSSNSLNSYDAEGKTPEAVPPGFFHLEDAAAS